MFDKEQWVVVGDDKERVYADVLPNVVDVLPERGREYRTYIRVPSALFPYLRDVQRLSVEDIRKDTPCFYLQEDNGVWYFGFTVGSDTTDLWKYRSLPAWAQLRR